MKTLADAFEHTLKDMYYAENAIVKALPKLIKEVSQSDFKAALELHLKETKEQIRTLDKVFKSIDKKPSGEKCDAIEGLLKETDGIIEEATGTVAKHASLAAICQAVEHYEISRYGTLREWAKALKNDEAHTLLTEILDMEKAANSKINAIAIDSLNRAA
ncbi:MAG TPA: ferritin-like domain-containing protein [Aestuariivirga sp.]|nr:ferritin-like domain-containing protein [Alphaproteobacteria bacterium]HRX36448.1 ferritin-like domain-containing protein [Aestuariivirga sp.]